MDRSRPPLRWMIFEAGAAGLRTAPFQRDLLVYQQINIIESLRGAWWGFEIFPFKRLTFTREEGRPEITRKYVGWWLITFTERGICQASFWVRPEDPPGSKDPQLLGAGCIDSL